MFFLFSEWGRHCPTTHFSKRGYEIDDFYVYPHAFQDLLNFIFDSARGDPLAATDVYRSFAGGASSPELKSGATQHLRATWSPGMKHGIDSEVGICLSGYYEHNSNVIC